MIAHTELRRVIRLVASGKLPRRRETRLWTWAAFRGAGRFVGAMLAGDVAPKRAAHERVNAACARCDALKVWEAHGDVYGLSCGEVGRPVDTEGRESCGCIVGQLDLANTPARNDVADRVGTGLRNGAATPAGKTMVASEACPRGIWGPVTHDAHTEEVDR